MQEGRPAFSRQSTCDGGRSLGCQQHLDEGPGSPGWEISGRQAKWRPQLNELGLVHHWGRFDHLSSGGQRPGVVRQDWTSTKHLGLH